MKEKSSDTSLMVAYFFLATGIISFLSGMMTLLVCVYIGFQPIRENGLSDLFTMTYVPLGWTVLSLILFVILFSKSKRQYISGARNNSDK